MKEVDYSPHDLLPVDNPREEPYKDIPNFFYDNVIIELMPDVLRMMHNGVPIDLERVAELEDVVVDVLDSVTERLSNSKLINEFQEAKDRFLKAKKSTEIEGKQKDIAEFIKVYDFANTIHRTYVVNEYLKHIGKYKEFKLDKWLVNDVKKVNDLLGQKFFIDLLDKSIPIDHPIILKGMYQLAKDKADIFNKKKLDKIDELDTISLVDTFNPNSSTQKQDFFGWLGIESEEKTKTDNDSFNRKELERLLELVSIMIDQEEQKEHING